MNHEILGYTKEGKPIYPIKPSARARAERFGGTPRDYTLLFPNHADCVVKAREQETIDLMRRLNADAEED